jgi:uncharacterized RDD family membrane protein YckC
MAAPAITVLKNNVPWGPFTRAQVDEGLARGDYTLRYLAHATGLKEWLPLGEVLDYVDRHPDLPQLPPVPGARDLPPIPTASRPAPPKPLAPPVMANIAPAEPVAITPVPAPEAAKPREEEKPAIKLEPTMMIETGSEPITASFLPRAIAFLIDFGLLMLPLIALYLLGALAIEIPAWWEKLDQETRTQEWDLLHRNFWSLFWLVIIGGGWLYGAIYESSPAQATIGKRWMGLKVIGTRGGRLGFLRATGRYAGKYLSALPCFLGFILALFNSRGQALHDLLAETRVVRK